MIECVLNHPPSTWCNRIPNFWDWRQRHTSLVIVAAVKKTMFIHFCVINTRKFKLRVCGEGKQTLLLFSPPVILNSVSPCQKKKKKKKKKKKHFPREHCVSNTKKSITIFIYFGSCSAKITLWMVLYTLYTINTLYVSYQQKTLIKPNRLSQHVPVESSSLLHHSIYLWFICFPWWSIDELKNLHADRTTVCFEPW